MQPVYICLFWSKCFMNPFKNTWSHKAKQMQPVWICVLSGKPFEKAFENTQWRKTKYMQPMWLCVNTGSYFEGSFENTQWGKVKQMQPLWLCILLCKLFEDTFENTKRRKVKQMQPMWLYIYWARRYQYCQQYQHCQQCQNFQQCQQCQRCHQCQEHKQCKVKIAKIAKIAPSASIVYHFWYFFFEHNVWFFFWKWQKFYFSIDLLKAVIPSLWSRTPPIHQWTAEAWITNRIWIRHMGLGLGLVGREWISVWCFLFCVFWEFCFSSWIWILDLDRTYVIGIRAGGERVYWGFVFSILCVLGILSFLEFCIRDIWDWDQGCWGEFVFCIFSWIWIT